MTSAKSEARVRHNRRYYEAGGKARVQARKKVHQERNRLLTQSIRNDTPCTDCGLEGEWWKKDFDHVRGEKINNVGSMVDRPVSLATLHAEIVKCEVVCANCHRDRTYKRRLASLSQRETG